MEICALSKRISISIFLQTEGLGGPHQYVLTKTSKFLSGGPACHTCNIKWLCYRFCFSCSCCCVVPWHWVDLSSVLCFRFLTSCYHLHWKRKVEISILNPTSDYYIDNNTVHGRAKITNLFQVLTRISHDWAKRTSEISCSTWEINFIFPSIHVLFCLLHKKLVCLNLLNYCQIFGRVHWPNVLIG